MTQKQEEALNKIISALPDNCRESYREVAEYAVSLGYMPSLKGTSGNYLDFTKSRVKRTILKIQTNPQFPYFEMKFYAIPAYSAFFQRAVDERLLTWSRLKYEVRCFGCGKCDGTEGYKVTLIDGKQGFLCGFGLLPLPSFNAESVTEVKEALRVQDAFFMKQISE
jgi:hypothetical protein